MDNRSGRARLRFQGMLADARAALKSSEAQPDRAEQAKAILTAVKALNRAGGFLEAISMTQPDLGSDLIQEFESFAREVDALSGEPTQRWPARTVQDRRERQDRRDQDRRLEVDRRTQELAVVAERRVGSERRTGERRTGPRRMLTDRRSDQPGRWSAN